MVEFRIMKDNICIGKGNGEISYIFARVELKQRNPLHGGEKLPEHSLFIILLSRLCLVLSHNMNK